MTGNEDGHDTSWRGLYDELKRRLCAQIGRWAAAFDPEEVFHEALVKAISSHPDATTLADPSAYVAVAARSIISDRVRKENTNNVGSLEDLSEGNKKQLANQAVTERRTARQLDEWFEGLGRIERDLNRTDRLMLRLRLNDKSWDEIADTLGISVADAKKRSESVKDKLKYRIKKQEAEP